MSLEQRTKGLQGRISALEARLSGTACDDRTSDPGNGGDVEFVAAAQLSSPYPAHGTLDARPSALEQTLNAAIPENTGLSRAFDATGLIAGAILIGAGLLLFTGNIEIVRNPLAVMGCGILLIGTAIKRIVL
jgi:hypothetical protein